MQKNGHSGQAMGLMPEGKQNVKSMPSHVSWKLCYSIVQSFKFSPVAGAPRGSERIEGCPADYIRHSVGQCLSLKLFSMFSMYTVGCGVDSF